MRADASTGITHLIELQQADGRWEGEMVWNTMLLSQYVLSRHVLGHPLSTADTNAAQRHYEVTQRSDGAWPLHTDGPGSTYVTTLAYVALRVLGTTAEDPLTAPARAWLAKQPDGVAALPTWGRMWLALLGLFDYEAINPIPPELVLLPEWFPLHPDQFYCHTRYVYLGLAYLYGRRSTFNLAPGLQDALLAELFGDTVSDPSRQPSGPDVVAPPHPLLRWLYRILAGYERRPFESLRRRALARCAARLGRELDATRGHGLSPVNALLACLVLAEEGADVTSALKRLDAWRWSDDEGLRITGARSSAWDTAFTLRALVAAPANSAVIAAVRHGYSWLCSAQQTAELDEPGRDGIRGGWCFSDGTHRWPVSDCTAEALSAVLLVHRRPDLLPKSEHVPLQRLHDAVRFILARQNSDGGFGTYERRRAPLGLERLNPSEMYLNCMTDQSHVECTASCVSALARFAQHDSFEQVHVQRAIGRGVDFLRRKQLPDGSYPAAWGVCFTYSAFFVTEALSAAGVDSGDQAIAGVVDWLVHHQKPDGGWGEHHSSCLTGTYVEHPASQASMTAWALLALKHGNGPDEVLRGGRDVLLSLQNNGRWPHQAPSGVFFGSAVLDYRHYKDVFPTWALAELSA